MAEEASTTRLDDVEAIFESGPPRRLTALARLPSPLCPNAGVRLLLVLAIGWAPLAALVVLDALSGRPQVLPTFGEDIGVHARYAFAAPILVLAHALCARRLGAIAHHFLVSGLLDADGQLRLTAALEAARRRVRSLWAEALVFLTTYLLAFLALATEGEALRQSAWQTDASGVALSAAGWWHAMVSMPLLVVLLLGWAWRIANWAWFLRQVSRLDLHLIASHPDQAGGLGFLAQSVRAFAPVGFGLGAIVAGRFAYVYMHGLANPFTNGLLLGGAVGIVLLLAVGPVAVFAVPLARAWRKGGMSYGRLANEIGLQLESAWLTSPGRVAKPMLSEPDFSATTDLYQVVANVNSMRFLPVDPRSILILIGFTLAPFVPAALISMPASLILAEVKALLF